MARRTNQAIPIWFAAEPRHIDRSRFQSRLEDVTAGRRCASMARSLSLINPLILPFAAGNLVSADHRVAGHRWS